VSEDGKRNIPPPSTSSLSSVLAFLFCANLSVEKGIMCIWKIYHANVRDNIEIVLMLRRSQESNIVFQPRTLPKIIPQSM
jgi:hypothetical protein